MKIFFAGPLTTLKNYKKTRRFYQKLARTAKECGYDYFWAFLCGTDPNRERKIPAHEVYKRDTKELLKSDIMVAYIGEPSTGTGVEIEFAKTHNKPVVLLYEKRNWTSRMARGCPSVKKEIIFSSQRHACIQFKSYLQKLKIV